MATIKRQVYTALEQDLSQALAEADGLMLQSFTAPDFAEGVTSFLERRDPRFAVLSGAALSR
jgi:enoyl-CoA hydratase/carnithine racemase